MCNLFLTMMDRDGRSDGALRRFDGPLPARSRLTRGKHMQFPGQGKPAVGILFDAGWATALTTCSPSRSFTDSTARARRALSPSVSARTILMPRRLCEAVERFYAGTGPFAAFFRGLPVGLSTDGKPAPPAAMVTAPFAKKNPDGKPVLNSAFRSSTTPPIRPRSSAMLCTAQHDANALVVLSGPATNLAKRSGPWRARGPDRPQFEVLVAASERPCTRT